ncbi:MAG: 23S rRNA (adenine(2503)-C(2))-methyltransferase RlmN, partial [Chloroflexota bacterium]|nr:23S rRNA (adenine(2503)-C(2))-methyltransferase RlmN [Chloroflexota bacterium]
MQSGEPIPLTDTPNGDLPAFLKSANQPAYRVGQVRRWLYRDLATGFHEMSNLPAALRKKLAERYTPHGLLPGPIQQSEDGTHKFLFSTPDGAPVEAVLLPRRRGYALCISTQSGCAMGCPFCATGTLGLIRNLTGGEIVDQFLRGRRHARALGSELESVIFMGMGEP